MKHMKLKVLKDIPGYKAGNTVDVETNGGIPVVKFWRERMRDADIDNCVEIVKTEKSTIEITEGDQ